MITSMLGTTDSQLGVITPGYLADRGSTGTIYNVDASDAIVFSGIMSGDSRTRSVTTTITFSDTTSANKLKLVDNIFFAEVLKGWNLSQPISTSISFADQSTAIKLSQPAFDTIVFSDLVSAIKLKLLDNITYMETLVLYNVNVSVTTSIAYSDLVTCVVLRLEDTLVLNDTLVGTRLILSDFLVLTDLNVFSAIYSSSLTESISFDELIYKTLPETATDSITLSETLTEDKVNPAFDVLEPFDTVSVITLIEVSIDDNFNLTEIVTGNASIPLSETFSLTETIIETNSKKTSDSLTYSDSITVNKILNKIITDTVTYTETKSLNRQSHLNESDNLSLSDSAKAIRVQFVSVTDTTIILDELIGLRHDEAVTDDINFDSSVSIVKIAVGLSTDILNLEDTNNLNTVINPNIPDELNFRELAFGITADKYLMLIGVSRAIALPPPEFNDNYATQQKTIFKRTMDATVRTYNKTSDNEKIHYDFVLTRIQSDNLRGFLDSENGNYINLIDWRGYRYRVKLYTDSVNFEESGRWEPCGNKVRTSMEFLGKRCMT